MFNAVSAATDQVVKHLQEGLELEVSAKKSVTVAGRDSIARGIAAISKTKKLSAKRSTKILGAPSGGGRRRCVKALAVRMTAFAKRIPRIRALRRHGISTIHVARAAGTPMVT